jgi:hypothetical protein
LPKSPTIEDTGPVKIPKKNMLPMASIDNLPVGCQYKYMSGKDLMAMGKYFQSIK